MKQFTVYEFGVDEMPIEHTVIVRLSTADMYVPCIKTLCGFVNYDIPQGYDNVQQAIAAGVEMAYNQDWFDENGNILKIACIVGEEEYNPMVKGEHWMYLHDYIVAVNVIDDVYTNFPFMSKRYLDIAIENQWVELLFHTIEDRCDPLDGDFTSETYTVKWNNTIYKSGWYAFDPERPYLAGVSTVVDPELISVSFNLSSGE